MFQARFSGSLAVGLLGALLLAACAQPPVQNRSPIATEPSSTGGSGITPPEEQYRIVTLLPRDAIPAIDNPVFLAAEEADSEYAADERVLGVFFHGEARAYSINLLSNHEIVNDEIGDIKFAVTW